MDVEAMTSSSLPASQQQQQAFAPAAYDARAERLLARSGGVDGNDRLTSSIGLVLLAVESATLLSLRSLVGLHISLGLALLVPVAVKIASTAWRFTRYYTRSRPYVDRGPPQIALRLLGPPLVLTTVVLLATGITLLAVGPRGGIWFTLHKLSFIVWVGLIGIHVLAHLEHSLRTARADWQHSGRLGGRQTRRLLLAGTLSVALIVGVATIPTSKTWVTWMKTHHHHDGQRSASVGASAPSVHS
jgi:hypothetical protein